MSTSAQNTAGWSSTANGIWDAARPIAGTLAETYLNGRRCHVGIAEELRFLPPNGNSRPALVARVTDFCSGEPISLHFIDLDPATGNKIGQKRFLQGHSPANGVVRLELIGSNLRAPLGLCEGIEDALSIIRYREHASFPIGPVWATCGTSTLGGLKRPPLLGDLVIWADNDQAGSKAAKKLTDKWAGIEIDVRIVPPTFEKDWNDDLQKEAL